MGGAAGTAFLLAESLLAVARAYALVGAFVGVAFLLFGLDRIDPAAGNSYAFRALIFPGLVLLWPLVILRWRRQIAGVAPRPALRQRSTHLAVWLSLALLIPIVLGFAFAQRRVAFPQPLNIRLITGVAP
jgi:hypothetical protein